MKIVRLSKNSNLNRIDKVFNWFRFSGRGPQGEPGTIGTLDLLDPKPTPIDADLMLVGDSTDSFANKKITWANIKATLKTFFNTIYAILSSIQAHGLIITDETFSSATKSEHTASADSAADITLVLITARPSMLIAINVTTICTLSLVGAGITYTFPTGQTANLTDLAVGLWHIVPNTTDNGANVVVRVQQVS